MQNEPVNITVVTYNRYELTKICLESVLELTNGNFYLNVIDNFSTDQTWNYLNNLHKSDNRVNIARMSRNVGVAAAANYGWSLAPHLHYIKLDNDIEILQRDWLEILLDYINSKDNIGCIGYKFLDKHCVNETTLANGTPFWEFDTCGGACTLIPNHVHKKAGFWNEDYGKYGFEDMEYSLRCRLLGYKVGYVPLTDRVRHLGYDAMSPEYELSKKKQVADNLVGEKMYFLNKLMFEEGIRPLLVERRFLPIPNTDPVRLKSNPAYASILKIQNLMQKSVEFGKTGEKVILDLSKWKNLT